MTEFKAKLLKIAGMFEELKAEERAIAHKSNAANLELQALLKESGLPENFTLPEALLLAIEKAHD